MAKRIVCTIVLAMGILCTSSAQEPSELPEYVTVGTAEFIAVLRDYVRLLRLEEQMTTAKCL